jgi:hypothetical protein
VTEPFSLAPSRCAVVSDPALREEIDTHTGSAEATSGILRSIDRFGTDPSILSYEMTPKPQGRNRRLPDAVAWTVHAVRASVAPPEDVE